MPQRRQVVKPEACTMGCESIFVRQQSYSKFCVYHRVLLSKVVADPVVADNPPDVKKPSLWGQALGPAERRCRSDPWASHLGGWQGWRAHCCCLTEVRCQKLPGMLQGPGPCPEIWLPCPPSYSSSQTAPAGRHSRGQRDADDGRAIITL